MTQTPPRDDDAPGFDRTTALFWGGVLSVTVLTVLMTVDSATYASGAVCIADTASGACRFARVAVSIYNVYFAILWTVIGGLWLVRNRERDAHPWIVVPVGLAGAMLPLFMVDSVLRPVAYAVRLQTRFIAMVAITAFSMAAVALACRFRVRRRHWAIRAAMVVLPLVLVAATGVEIRGDQQIRARVQQVADYHIFDAVGDADVGANHFPSAKKQRLSTLWLSAPPPSFDRAQRDAIEQTIGHLESGGRGRDLRAVLDFIARTAAAQKSSPVEVAASMGAAGALQNVYVVGRHAAGYCLDATRLVIEGGDAVKFVNFGHGQQWLPSPKVRREDHPIYCVLGDEVIAFDGDEATPRRAARLACAPTRPPNPYGTTATERLLAHFLLAVARPKPGKLDALAAEAQQEADKGAVAPFVAHMIRAFRAGPTRDTTRTPDYCDDLKRWSAEPPAPGAGDLLKTIERAAHHANDAHASADAERNWERFIDTQLGQPPDLPPDARLDTMSAKGRAEFLGEAIDRAVARVEAPDQAALRTVFGPLVDTFIDGESNATLFNSLMPRELGGGKRALDRMGQGVPVAEYIRGTKATGWCAYRVHASAVEEGGDQPIRAKLVFELRYCLAGERLYAFEGDKVRQSWDAAGFSRVLPIAKPRPYDKRLYTDPSNRAGLEQSRQRTRVLIRFLDALVDGELSSASQLDTLMLAQGAGDLDADTRNAMRRMVGEAKR